MQFKDYILKTRTTVPDSVKHWKMEGKKKKEAKKELAIRGALGMVGEMSEVRYVEDKEELYYEVGDLMWYVATLVNALGIQGVRLIDEDDIEDNYWVNMPWHSIAQIAEKVKKYSFHGKNIYLGDVHENLMKVIKYFTGLVGGKEEMGKVLDMNIEKLKERYPDGFYKRYNQ